MPNYGDIAYWNKRYKEQAGTTYDWLLNYEHFREMIKQYVLNPKLSQMLREIQQKHEKLAKLAELEKAKPQPKTSTNILLTVKVEETKQEELKEP